MRLVFAGTPETALPSLEAIAGSRHELVAVVTRPDAPAGRGRRLAASPVAERAAELGAEVLRPAKPSDPDFLDRLRELAPDCCPVVAYGGLLPQAALDIPAHGWVNLHFSVLPAWRGAAPVQHAIIAGDDVTGASTFRIVKELDAGPVYGVLTEPIDPADDSGTLLGRLAVSGAKLLVDTLDGIEDGILRPQEQPADGISIAPKLTVDDARLDLTAPALRVDRLVRGCHPAPGAWTTFRGERLKIDAVRPAPQAESLAAGELRVEKRSVEVGTGSHPVELVMVRPQKKPMTGADWARGVRPEPDERLGTEVPGQADRNARNRTPDKRVDQVRRTAYQVIRQVNGEDGYANLVLSRTLRERGFQGRDAAFCTELVHGTLRWQGTYDVVLGRCVSRPIADVDPDLLDVLRLGTHQLLRMRVGAHAAVGETVTLARTELGQRRTGLVNAVLRKVSQRDFEQWIAAVEPKDEIGRLAVAQAHPRWVVEAFADALGNDFSEVAELLAADNEPPQVTLVARPGLATVEELMRSDEAGLLTKWSPYGMVLSSGDPGAIPAVADGRAGVQDEGSQLVALALADAPLDGRDEQWLDLCAGPGGKSALLAALGAPRGVVLTAVEPQSHRAELVRDNLRAVPGEHPVLVADGTEPTWSAGSFDRVLADVPCTGLGALRRRPEARWRRTPTDLETLRPLQEALLRAALDSVRPGGVVAYATCSPHRAETVDVVEAVLADRADVERIDVRPLLNGVPDLGAGPDVQLWPHRHNTDAMYLALLRRM